MFWNFQPSLCRGVGLLCLKAAKDFAERFKQILPIMNSLPFIVKPLANIKSPVKPRYFAYSTRQLATPIAQVKSNDMRAIHQRVLAKFAGFTLLEMLMVIGLLSVLMVTSISVITDESARQGESAAEMRLQQQQQSTVARWNQIRMAIIGDTNLTLSNPSMLSGYVADMGRLPANIKELLVKDYDPDDDPLTINNVVQPDWGEINLDTVTTGAKGKLWGGWRGPYLYTSGSRFFGDSWANIDYENPSLNDVINSGWNVTLSGVAPEYDDIKVQSLGKNGVPGGIGADEDFPEASLYLVSTNEWRISAASIGFNVMLNKAPLADQNLELRLYFIENGVLEEEISTSFNHLASVIGVTSHPVTINPLAPLTSISLPMGKYAAIVWCTAQNRVYEGDCGSTVAATKQPYYFTLLPSTSLPITIYWNIP